MDDYHSRKGNERQKSSLQEANLRPHKPWRLAKVRTYWNINEILKPIEGRQPNCWIQTTCPIEEDQQGLRERFQIPDYFLQDVDDTDEHVRYEYDDGWMLIILHTPYVKETHPHTPYATIPLGIIHKRDAIIMVCYYEINMVTDLVSYQQKRGSDFANYTGLAFRLFLSSAVWHLKQLKWINTLIKKTEHNLDHRVSNESLTGLSQLQDSFTYFITSVRGNEDPLAKLKFKLQIDELDADLIEDVNIEMTQVRETTNIHADILESTMDTYPNTINNNVNTVMKTPTSVSILMVPTTLVTSLHGMNVISGMETCKYSFIVAFDISILMTVVLWVIIRHKHTLQTGHGRMIRRTEQ